MTPHEPQLTLPSKMKTDESAAQAAIRPVGLSLQIIEQVAEWQPISTSELARRLALPKTTTHRLLLGLENFGWLERDDGPRALWSLTTRPITIGGRAIERKRGLRTAALSIMDSLRQATNETVLLGLLEEDNMVLIERIDGIKSVNLFVPIGSRWPLHWSSAGRTALAYLSEAQQADYLGKPLYRRKSLSEIMPPADLAAELVQIRERGFAITVGAPPASSSSVGTAIFDKHGAPFAGLSINGASNRLQEDELFALAPQLLEAARRISLGVSLS